MIATDRFKAFLNGFIADLTARYDYFALYGCTVLSQNGDGSLELRPDKASTPGTSNVPVRYGIPGVRATITAGARALMGWESGDPTRPYAIVVDPGALLTITITAATSATINAPSVALGAGTQPVARQGDPIFVVCPLPGIALVPGMALAGVISGGSSSVKSG